MTQSYTFRTANEARANSFIHMLTYDDELKSMHVSKRQIHQGDFTCTIVEVIDFDHDVHRREKLDGFATGIELWKINGEEIEYVD